MLLLRPDRRRGMLDRPRHLRRREVADLGQGVEEITVAGGEAGAHAGQVRALGERIEHDQVLEALGRRGRNLQTACGGIGADIDLRVALVRKQHEVVLARQRQRLGDVVGTGHRALWVGGRADEEGRGAAQDVGLARQRIEVGQVPGLGRGIEIDRLAVCRVGAAEVSLIERIGEQDDGPAGEALASDGRQCREKQAFA